MRASSDILLGGRARRPRSTVAALPTLLIVGAQKCGTSSLHRYLDMHPEIGMSEPKELDFFYGPSDAQFGGGNWHRGVEWYASHFSQACAVRGESSPNYSIHPLITGVPERAATLVPDAKILLLVRDPIERIISHYLHRRGAGREPRSLEEALSDLKGAGRGFVYRSMYAMQLERWLGSFPRSSVLVLAQEDLLARRLDTLRRVFRFLAVDETFTSQGFESKTEVTERKREPRRLEARVRNSWLARAAGGAPAGIRAPARRALQALSGPRLERPQLSEETRERLRSALREDAARLREITGESYPTWSV